MKNITQTITMLFSPKWIILGIAIFIFCNLAVYLFFIQPNKSALAELTKKSEQLTESYINLKSIDINNALEHLTLEIELLKKKENAVLKGAYKNDELPLFITRLENSATRSGLEISSPVLTYQEEEFEEMKMVRFNIVFKGTLPQLMQFLKTISSVNRGLLLDEFSITSEEQSPGYIKGHINFLSFVKNE